MKKRYKQKQGVIAFTMGDPGGIGPEILVKALKKEKPGNRCAYLVIGAKKAFETLRKKTGFSLPFKVVRSISRGSLHAGNICFLDKIGRAHV